jgi:nitrite reductase/ring-hydroxylating ferredoxin subunit/uncharacterized membrane protein
MRSKANIKGHPLHPVLIAFPTAAFTGTFVFDALSLLLNKQSLWMTSTHIEIGGVISGFVAAIPGIIDYRKTVPPNSSAKKRAAKHGILNATHILIFLSAWLMREDYNKFIILAMEFIGVILLSIAGFLGGTLVYRNQIGVDIRFAGAGKWSEIKVTDSNDPVQVALKDELKINQMKLVHFGDKRIVIGRTEEGYVAFDDRCTHRGGSLAGGAMMCGTVQCPWHGSQFDTKTGAVKAGPSNTPINTYKITEVDGKILLMLS